MSGSHAFAKSVPTRSESDSMVQSDVPMTSTTALRRRVRCDSFRHWQGTSRERIRFSAF